MKKHILICFLFILCGFTNGQNINNADSTMHYAEKDASDTIFDKQAWMNLILAQFSDKLTTELQQNFNHSTPFIITRIQDCHKFYAIDIEDTTHQYRYTIVSVKKKRWHSKKIIKENEKYDLVIKNITNFSGLIGTSEIPFDVTFIYQGKKIRYKSVDNLNGPPVITEDLKGIYYEPLNTPQKKECQ